MAGTVGRVSEFVGGYWSTGGGYRTVPPRVWHPSKNFISLCSLNLLLFVSDCACRRGIWFFFLLLLYSSVVALQSEFKVVLLHWCSIVELVD